MQLWCGEVTVLLCVNTQCGVRNIGKAACREERERGGGEEMNAYRERVGVVSMNEMVELAEIGPRPPK